MARLNEPADSQEIDSLKRRFLRQNKDLARSNSTLSQRIRNLENETSKLLAENLALREHLGRAQRISECAEALKEQLQTKMAEFGALINGIGDESLPRRKSQVDRTTAKRSPATSPDRRNWKNMCTLGESVKGQEGPLPTILENKYYPRKTLEREEILTIVESESPDIGPPPVSQFVDEDPVKIDLPKKKTRAESEESSPLDPTLSVNLEQRRKRKDSTVPSEIKLSTNPEISRPTKDEQALLKIGSKRKLSVREDEEGQTRPGADSPDDFKYTRVASEERPRNKSQPLSQELARKIAKDHSARDGPTKEKDASANITATRKILAPKSVNDSPRKISKSISGDGKAGKGEPIKSSAAKDRPREKKQEAVRITPPVQPVLEVIEVEVEPETPAGGDLFSPLSSQPSTARIESRDTPPPPDLNKEGEGQRPSRRARGAVSYAEPNLRDKMRRPTKDLVDAVGKDDKPVRENLMKSEAEIGSAIKPESEVDDAWKQMPIAASTAVENSPLSNKAPVSESLPSAIITQRRRRESLLSQVEMESARPGSATAIAALLAETRKVKAAAKEKTGESETVAPKATNKIDIYEFTGSPPGSIAAATHPAKVEKTVASRFSRRQSSAPRSGSAHDDGEASDIEAPKRSEPFLSSRRQSTLGVRSASATSLRSMDQETGKPLKISASSTVILDSAVASRNDRITARRRSMML